MRLGFIQNRPSVCPNLPFYIHQVRAVINSCRDDRRVTCAVRMSTMAAGREAFGDCAGRRGLEGGCQLSRAVLRNSTVKVSLSVVRVNQAGCLVAAVLQVALSRGGVVCPSKSN
jgi:hypothetical protein